MCVPTTHIPVNEMLVYRRQYSRISRSPPVVHAVLCSLVSPPDMATTTNSHYPRSLLLHNIIRLTKSAFQTSSTEYSPPTNPVAFSAQLCAASRAIETQRPPSQRLFTDVYAEALAGPEVMALTHKRLLKLQAQGKSLRPRIQIRTRYFDDFALQQLAVSSSQRVQLVSLAAGLETRAFRLQLTEAVSVFEVDVKEVLERKEHVLSCVEPPPSLQAGSRSVVVADLSKKGWEEALESAGFYKNVRTVWLVEGLLYYLQASRVEELLTEIWELSARESAICFSAVLQMREKRGEWKSGDGVGGLSKLFQSAMPQPREVMESIGWQVLAVDRLGGENANYGRWVEDSNGNTIYVSARRP